MPENYQPSIDVPKIATGMPPATSASSDLKGIYTVARWAAQNDHYVGFYKTWTKAQNFLVGEHWRTKWDGTSLSWNAEKGVPAWHQQPVTNITYAVFRSALAKLTKQKPSLEVVPPSGDSDDKEAAELADAVLIFLWRLLRKPQKVPVLVGWLLLTGKAYVRVGWDPLAGPMQPRTIPMQAQARPLGMSEEMPLLEAAADDMDAEDVDVAADEMGNPYRSEDGAIDFAREPALEPTGEICWEVVSPLCVRVNPEASSHEDAYEFYVATLWPKNKAAEHFGVPEEKVGQFGDSDEQRALYEDLMSATVAGFPRSWSDQSSVWGVSQEMAIGSRVLVVEYYHDKTRECPAGRHWISAGPVKVWPPENAAQAAAAKHPVQPGAAENMIPESEFPNGEAPLPFGFWPPLVPCLDTPIPGQPHALGMIPQVVPLNEQLNVLDGKIVEKHVMDTMGGVWFVAPEDANIQITSEPGQVIVSRAMGRRGQAFAPFQSRMQPLPDPVYREREVMMSKVMVVSGLTSLDLQQKAQGTASGRALLINQETSDSALMPTTFALESCLEECGRRELVIAQQKYTEERVIAVKGESGEWLFRSFKGADLRAGHDVRVNVGSSFPWLRSAQWDTKIQVIEKLPQLVMKPDGTVDRQKLAKYLDSGAPGLSAFESTEDPDLVEIQREHAMFDAYNPERGALQIPQLAFWQNHATHLEQHYDFMKRDYGRYKRWHPAAQEAFKQHMQLTQLAVEELARALMGNQTAPVGGGEGAPPSGEPGTPTAPALSLVAASPKPQTRINANDTKDAARAASKV